MKIDFDSPITFLEFASIVKIKTPDGERCFNDAELAEIKKISDMKDKGYDLALIRCRGGNKVGFVKRDTK
jgi:hypothetical protein